MTDYFLESPDYFNKEIIFAKGFDTKYLHASLDYHQSLSSQDLRDIYMAVLGAKDSCYVRDKFRNYAGFSASRVKRAKLYSVNSYLITELSHYWQNNNLKTQFISEKDTVIQQGEVLNHFHVIYLSPVKLIDGKVYVGYNSYCGPLCGSGLIFEIQKSNSKWIANVFACPWIS